MASRKKLWIVFLILAVLLSDVMCAVVAYDYCAMKWCGQYAGCSAPAYVALFELIPFGIAIAACGVLSRFFYRKWE